MLPIGCHSTATVVCIQAAACRESLRTSIPRRLLRSCIPPAAAVLTPVSPPLHSLPTTALLRRARLCLQQRSHLQLQSLPFCVCEPLCHPTGGSTSSQATLSLCLQGKKKQSLVNRLQKACTSSNLVLLSLWAVWGLLVVYTQYMGTDVTPFDPFAILQLSPGADSSDIKKAYR